MSIVLTQLLSTRGAAPLPQWQIARDVGCGAPFTDAHAATVASWWADGSYGSALQDLAFGAVVPPATLAEDICRARDGERDAQTQAALDALEVWAGLIGPRS